MTTSNFFAHRRTDIPVCLRLFRSSISRGISVHNALHLVLHLHRPLSLNPAGIES